MFGEVFLSYSWNPKFSQACWCLSQGIPLFPSRIYFFLNFKLLWTVFMPYFIISSCFLTFYFSFSWVWDILNSQVWSATSWPGMGCLLYPPGLWVDCYLIQPGSTGQVTLSCFRRVNLLCLASLAFLAHLTMAFGSPQTPILGALLLWVCPSPLIL